MGVGGVTPTSALLCSPTRNHRHTPSAELGEISAAFLRWETCTKGRYLRQGSKAPWQRFCCNNLQWAGPKQQAVPKHQYMRWESSWTGSSASREQLSGKPGCRLEAEQSKVVGGDHLLRPLDLSRKLLGQPALCCAAGQLQSL